MPTILLAIFGIGLGHELPLVRYAAQVFPSTWGKGTDAPYHRCNNQAPRLKELDHAQGGHVDATSIAALLSTKKKDDKRDPQMYQSKKGND